MTLKQQDINLTLFPSRSTIELGEVWDVLLRVENNSDGSVWITAGTTTLTLPAELQHPSQINVSSAGAQLPTVPGSGFDAVQIAAGGSYITQWRMNEDIQATDNASFWDGIMWHVFFHPGHYDIQTHIHVWDKKPDVHALAYPVLFSQERMKQEKAEVLKSATSMLAPIMEAKKNAEFGGGEATSPEIEPDPPELTEVPADKDTSLGEVEKLVEESIQKKDKTLEAMKGSLSLQQTGKVEVTAKSLTIFVASAVGGFAAFFLRELNALASESQSVYWRDLYLVPMYMLISIIITLFISRITEAKFPLTVKVMDFWGAIAIGILSAFGGHVILGELLSKLTT